MLVEHILHTDNVNANLPDSVLGWKQSRTKLFIFNSRYIHLKPPKIKNLKVNCVVLQACNNGSYLRNRLRNVLLILEKPIFKIGSLHLSNTEPTFRYGEMLKFWGLIGYIYNMLEMTFFLENYWGISNN